MSGAAMTIPRRFRPWRHMAGCRISVICAPASAFSFGAPVFRTRSAGFIEYPMLVKTDIPTAVGVAPDGAVWFTIEFSDAIGVFRNGKIERIRKGSQNLEPLGLAADGAGGAWYTDTPMRAISRISSDGMIRSFPLSTPIVRLGRLAVAPDGAVWFADIATASVTRLQDGVFMRHDVGSHGAPLTGLPSTPTAPCGQRSRARTSWRASRLMAK